MADKHSLEGHVSVLGTLPPDSNDPIHDQHRPSFSASGPECNPSNRNYLIRYAVLPSVGAPERLACSSAHITKSLPQRFLWNFFLEFSQETFTCFDSKDTSRFPAFQNPFGSLIPRMAVSSGCLRAAILCFSGMQYTLRTYGGALALRDETFYSRAIFCLISNSAETESLLPTITAGLFLHFCDQENKQNFLDVARSAAAYLADLVDNGYHPPSIEFQIVISLLRWTDISTLCSLRSVDTFIDENIHRRIELRQQEIINLDCSHLNGWINHPVFPFSTHLINPLLRLGRLIQYTTFQRSYAGATISNVEQNISQLEEDILSAVDVFRASQVTTRADCEPLTHLNAAMHSATLLLFYSRLKKMPFTATLVRQCVQELVNHVELISIGSPPCNGIFFPLIVAGCEAVDLTSRCVILNRIGNHYNIQNSEECTTSLQRIWAIRDAEPGLLWPAWRDKGLFSH